MTRALVVLVAVLAVSAGTAQAKKPTKRTFTGSVQLTQVSSWDETYQDYDQAASCSRTVHRNGTQNVTLANPRFKVTVKRVQGLYTFLVPSAARMLGTVDRQRPMAYVGDEGQGVVGGQKGEPIQTTDEGPGTVTLDWTLSLSR